MNKSIRVNFCSAAVILLALTGCSSGSDVERSADVFPVTMLGIAGLWDAKSISDPNSTTVVVPSGTLYFNFTNVTLSGLVGTFYSKSNIGNCLNVVGPSRMSPAGGNSMEVDGEGGIFNFVLDDRVNDVNDELTMTIPFESNLITKFSRAFGISPTDLQVCSRNRIDDSAISTLTGSFSGFINDFIKLIK